MKYYRGYKRGRRGRINTLLLCSQIRQNELMMMIDRPDMVHETLTRSLDKHLLYLSPSLCPTKHTFLVTSHFEYVVSKRVRYIKLNLRKFTHT